MEPQENILSPKQKQEFERLAKSEALMRSVREKFPNESGMYGIKNAPKSHFVILKTPIIEKGESTSISGDSIPIEISKHLIVTQRGIRVLELRNTPGSNQSLSEEIFQKTISRNLDSLQDPMSYDPQNEQPISPYYNINVDENREGITLFNKDGSSTTAILGQDIYPSVSLRNLKDGEMESFIENSKRAEQEKSPSDIKTDINNVDKMEQLLG